MARSIMTSNETHKPLYGNGVTFFGLAADVFDPKHVDGTSSTSHEEVTAHGVIGNYPTQKANL